MRGGLDARARAMFAESHVKDVKQALAEYIMQYG